LVGSLKDKLNKSKAIADIIGKRVSEDAAKAYAAAIDEADNVAKAMGDLGFTFDTNTREWVRGQ